MKNKKLSKVVAGVCSLLLFLVLVFVTDRSESQTKEKTYRWKFADYSPPGSPSVVASKRFAKRVSEASSGRIVIDIFDSQVLGDWTSTFEELKRGTIQMSMALLPPSFDPRYELLSLPYLVSNYKQVETAFGPNGLLYKTTSEISEQIGIKTLSAWPRGFGGLALTKLPPSPANPDVPKKMKIRIWPSKMAELLAIRLGYIPTVIPGAESFQAMQTGVVEGGLGCDPITAWEHWRDVIKYWVQINDHFEASWFAINLNLWKSLSQKDQKILMDAALAEWTIQVKQAAATEEEYRKKLADYGVKMVPPTPEEIKKCADACRKDVWPEMEPRVGKDLIKKVNDYLRSL
jgi:TRAP-type C4-dicarboxylate transport system substrate-binding protein